MSRIAFLYPGQGAQEVGMAGDFYEKRRKVNLLVILSVFICLVFVTLNSVKFKFY